MLTNDQWGLGGIRLKAISQEMLQIFIIDMTFKMTNLNLEQHPSGANVLMANTVDTDKWFSSSAEFCGRFTFITIE